MEPKEQSLYLEKLRKQREVLGAVVQVLHGPAEPWLGQPRISLEYLIHVVEASSPWVSTGVIGSATWRAGQLGQWQSKN
jgi:hypothetical protein